MIRRVLESINESQAGNLRNGLERLGWSLIRKHPGRDDRYVDTYFYRSPHYPQLVLTIREQKTGGDVDSVEFRIIPADLDLEAMVKPYPSGGKVVVINRWLNLWDNAKALSKYSHKVAQEHGLA